MGERAAGTLVELEAGFVTERDAVAAAEAVGRGASAVDVGPALDAALDAWMAHARPVRAGRVHVRPSWLAPDDDPPGAGEQVVVLDPTRAFGSGSHPSTLACLRAVSVWAGPGVSVLDVGCGTGVLAVAAAALGAGPVVAVDLDPVAVAACDANARSNGVAVTVGQGSADTVTPTFDLVLANVGAAAVMALAPALASRTRGRLVVAGLHESRADEVATALAREGMTEGQRRLDGGWAALIHHWA